jgi:hypothetical protein
MVRHMTAIVVALAVAIGVWARHPAAAEDGQVDLLLVLAADISRSIDEKKFRLQRDGYAAAIVDPRVVRAMQAGASGRIAICYMEWASDQDQRVIVEWTRVGNEGEAKEVADRIREAPRAFMGRTAIGAAIDFSMGLLSRSPFGAPRQIIDVSGDGTNNSGRDVTQARDEAVAQGVTINGLVILSETPLAWNPDHTNPAGGLENYYRNNVIGGPGAFVMAAQGFNSFGQAIVKKMIAEVAQAESLRRTLAR